MKCTFLRMKLGLKFALNVFVAATLELFDKSTNILHNLMYKTKRFEE